MPNQYIEEICKAHLQASIIDNESHLHDLFKDEKWKKQTMGAFYGRAPESEHLVDIAVIRMMGQYCNQFKLRLPNQTKGWLIGMINYQTVIYDGANPKNVLDLMSIAASYTEEIKITLSK